MIDIYRIREKSDGTIEKIKLQTIPADSQDELFLLNPTVKTEMGNAESMDFSVQSGTPYYDAFTQMRTYIQVVYDGVTIFYGRVLTIDNGAFGTRKIHCEGALSFLNDSYFPPKPEKSRDTQTIEEHIREVISNHNSQLNDQLREFAVGNIPGNYGSTSSAQRIANESREFGTSSWTESKSMLEDLKSHYGGCFRTRYSGGKSYLDWMNHYFRSTVNEQTIEVGKNLIDISGTTEVNNIFTAVIPVGKAKDSDDKVYINRNGKKYMTIPEVRSFYTDSQLNSGYHTADDYKNAVKRYGLIFKTVEIQEASTPSELETKTAAWIKENYQGSIESFSVKAIDLRQIGENTQPILVGDQVTIKYMIGSADDFVGHRITDTLTCTSITYDIYNPENNQYTFGIPANALSKNYGVKNATKSSNQKASSPPASPSFGGSPEPEDESEKWRKAVYAELKKHKTWFKSTGRVETGPADRESMPNKQKIWHAHETLAEDGSTNYEVWTPWAPRYHEEGTQRIRYWQRDSQNRPFGTWTIGPESLFTISWLQSHYLFEYMTDEHEVDMTTDLSTKMPGTYTDEEGDLYLMTGTPVTDPETGEPIRETMAMFGHFDSSTGKFEFTSPIEFGAYDPEQGIYNFLSADGKSGYITRLVDGEYHYYEVDPNNPDQLIEVTNIRQMHMKQVTTDSFIGTITEGGLIEENGRINTYKFGQEIIANAYEGGDIVVAHVDGDRLELGSANTLWSFNVASRQNNVWVEPFIYVRNPDGTVERAYTDKAGVFNYRGYFDTETGEFVLKQTGSDTPHGEPIIAITANGIWDDKNLRLKGGIVTGNVGTASNPEYVTYVKSDRLVIGNKLTDLKVQNALIDSNLITFDEAQSKWKTQALVTETVLASEIYGVKGYFDSIIANYVQTKYLTSEDSALNTIYYKNLLGTGSSLGYIRAGQVSSSSIYIRKGLNPGGGDNNWNINQFISNIQVIPSGDDWQLQYMNAASDTWHDVSPNGTFNRAATIVGEWSGGIYSVSPTVGKIKENISTRLNGIMALDKMISDSTKNNDPRRNGNNAKMIGQDMYVTYYKYNPAGTGELYVDTGYHSTVWIDASIIFSDGVASTTLEIGTTTSSGGPIKYVYIKGNSSQKKNITLSVGDLNTSTGGRTIKAKAGSDDMATTTIYDYRDGKNSVASVDSIDLDQVQTGTSPPTAAQGYSYTDLTTLPNQIKAASRTYVWFRTRALTSGGSTLHTKWYRCVVN